MQGGKLLHLSRPRDAENAGIAMIPQELIYFKDLSVAENICVGRYPGRFGLTSQAKMNRYAAEQLARYDVAIEPSQRMKNLKIASLQLVEIVRALAIASPIILLDEPTATLNDAESADLHRILKRLTAAGVGVLYISHRMDEVYRFAPRPCAAQRRARRMVNTPETTPHELVAHMLGYEAGILATTPAAPGPRQEILSLVGWRRTNFPLLDDLNLSVASGEVVALFGRRGSGHEVVADGLAGRRRDIDGP